MREAIVKKLLSGGLAVNAGTSEDTNGNGPIFIDTPIANIEVYVLSNASQTTGTVRIEHAHSTTYSGTWITDAVVTCATAATLQVAAITGERMAVRARVSVTANGSGIDVIIKAS